MYKDSIVCVSRYEKTKSSTGVFSRRTETWYETKPLRTSENPSDIQSTFARSKI